MSRDNLAHFFCLFVWKGVCLLQLLPITKILSPLVLVLYAEILGFQFCRYFVYAIWLACRCCVCG